jgi:hypothetical protein
MRRSKSTPGRCARRGRPAGAAKRARRLASRPLAHHSASAVSRPSTPRSRRARTAGRARRRRARVRARRAEQLCAGRPVCAGPGGRRVGGGARGGPAAAAAARPRGRGRRRPALALRRRGRADGARRDAAPAQPAGGGRARVREVGRLSARARLQPKPKVQRLSLQRRVGTAPRLRGTGLAAPAVSSMQRCVAAARAGLCTRRRQRARRLLVPAASCTA